jgi:bacterioferritin-associated ferredoxin
MYVCSCAAVSDSAVRRAVEAGAESVAEVIDECGAGGGCGSCWPALERLLESAGSRQSAVAA